MQQNNSFLVAEAFKKEYNACINGKSTKSNSYLVGDLSSSISSHEQQIQWGLLPGYNLVITMERPNKFRASLISPQFQTVDQFVLKTQLEVMLEKVITPDRATQEAIQPVVEMLVEMGFNEEVARLAAIEADNDIEKAVGYAIPLSSKISAENVLAIQANAGNIEKGLREFYKARLEHLTSFCLLCDRIVENHDGGKSCVCSRNLCEWQFKQIGLVPTSALVQPRLVRGLPPAFKVTSLSAGEDHSVACFENGEVYSWGNGERGQLGDGSFRSIASAMKLPHHKFSKAVAGNGFTLGLSADGDLWVWGTGTAELGLGKQDGEMVVPRPTKIDVYCEDVKYKRIFFKDIHVADRLCFAIAKDDSVYAWGEQSGIAHYDPVKIRDLRVKSLTAHYLHPVCVDNEGNILIWANWTEMFLHATVGPYLNAFSQPKSYRTAFSNGESLFALNAAHDIMHEYDISRVGDRYVLRQKRDHVGATQYAVGTGYVVLTQNGTVRVLGVGSGVMGYQETTVNSLGVEISKTIRNARHIAAGPHHVICVAMNDRIVHGQSEEETARDVFVYQWGRDHSAPADVQCQADIKKQKDQSRLAMVAQEAATAAAEKKLNAIITEHKQRIEPITIFREAIAAVTYVNENYSPDGLDLPQDELFESGEDLEKWNEQFLNSQQQECQDQGVPAVEINDGGVKGEAELSEQEKAVNVYLWCYHMHEQLNMTLDTDKSQLLVDLNHPAILLNKIANGESSRFKDLNINVDAQDHDGDTALVLAMQENDYANFTKVLELSPDLNVVNNKNEYPLDVALSCGGSYSKAFVVALVEKGATKCSSTNRDAIVDVINSAAEFVPKLKEKLELLLDE